MDVFRLTRLDTYPDEAARVAIVLADDIADARLTVQAALCPTGCVWMLPSTFAEYGSADDILDLTANSGVVLTR